MIQIHTVASGPKILCQYVVDLRYFTSGQKKYYFTTVDKKVIKRLKNLAASLCLSIQAVGSSLGEPPTALSTQRGPEVLNGALNVEKRAS